jgi:hypothetical protein
MLPRLDDRDRARRITQQDPVSLAMPVSRRPDL